MIKRIKEVFRKIVLADVIGTAGAILFFTAIFRINVDAGLIILGLTLIALAIMLALHSNKKS